MNHHCDHCGTSIGFKGICWWCQSEQDRNEVLAWTEEQIASKIQQLIAHVDRLDDWDTDEYEACCNLLEVHGIYPPALQRAALDAKVFSLERLYYKAPVDVRDGLITSLMESTDPREASELMSCLAMQGDDKALETLLELERNPQPWREQLYVNPSIYAQVAGWTFDQKGNRHELNYATCYVMEKGDKSADKAADIGRLREDNCPHCGCSLVDILVLDGRDKRLQFLGIEGIFTATCCPNCCCFSEAVFSRFTKDGGSTPVFPYNELIDDLENYIDEDTLKELCSNSYILGKTPVPLFYGAGSEDLNTIGGFASWVQDAQYITCPDCSQSMKYVAQIQWDTIMDYSEGTLYIEVCPDCSIASMHHQQT